MSWQLMGSPCSPQPLLPTSHGHQPHGIPGERMPPVYTEGMGQFLQHQGGVKATSLPLGWGMCWALRGGPAGDEDGP